MLKSNRNYSRPTNFKVQILVWNFWRGLGINRYGEVDSSLRMISFILSQQSGEQTNILRPLGGGILSHFVPSTFGILVIYSQKVQFCGSAAPVSPCNI